MDSKTEQRPLISVVTVVYNGAAHLEQTIQSVLSQKDPTVEYIIIDGGSTDGTLEIIHKYVAHLHYWVSEPDLGIFDAMNKGIRHASGSFIVMLNADDWYEPGILEKVAAEINLLTPSETHLDPVIYCDYYTFDESFTPPLKTGVTSTQHYWRGMTISHQTMFVPRALYDRYGLYHLEYRFAADYDFFLRLLQNHVTFHKLPVYGVNFRKGGASDSHMNRSINEVSRIVRRYFGVFSKEYPLFLLTNRLPSMLGNVRRLLTRIIGDRPTALLRNVWRKI